MKTQIHPDFQTLDEVKEAEAILRSCVHCGFCNATCPTYQELGDERDGPRGRIYLIKQFLEDGSAGPATQKHLDRCLSCRACETTCPSGVEYGRLADVGRNLVEQQVSRSIAQRVLRWGLLKTVPYPKRFGLLLALARFFKSLFPKSLFPKSLLPAALANKIPDKQKPSTDVVETKRHSRKMIALGGCVQSNATPNTLISARRVLDRLGITLEVTPEAGCCGAMSYHLSNHKEGLDFARKNIEAWWPAIEAGAEAIVITASGCGTIVKEYGDLLGYDPDYAWRAEQVSLLAKDISEVLAEEDLSGLKLSDSAEGKGAIKTAVHCPCSLQHGQQLPNSVASVLSRFGVPLANTEEDHLCCGSAGTYSILQPALSETFREKKLSALTGDNPQQIVTANVGCQLHLAEKADIPVRHWIEYLDDILN